jgi:aryl-alcohol dehydrogenase-like predicted oxidoreductase
MEYRELGRSGPRLPVITFGAWAVGGWMWGGSDRKLAVEAIRAAYDEGVTAIDTAPIYGQGLSEEIVGEAIKGLQRDRVQVLTKFGMRWDLPKGDFAMKSTDVQGRPIEVYKYAGKESVIHECEQSLRRLGTDHIDLYQIHWNDSTTPIAEPMEAVQRLIQQGKVRFAGVCNYDEQQLAEAKDHVRLVSDQVPYSMVRRAIDGRVVPFCQANGLGILAYSPLERGLLTGKLTPDHVFAEGDHRAGMRTYQRENIRRVNVLLDGIRPIAQEHGCTLGQLVLRWTLQRPGITVALVGARDTRQAVQNAKAADLRLSDADMAAITAAVDKLVLEN